MNQARRHEDLHCRPMMRIESGHPVCLLQFHILATTRNQETPKIKPDGTRWHHLALGRLFSIQDELLRLGFQLFHLFLKIFDLFINGSKVVPLFILYRRIQM